MARTAASAAVEDGDIDLRSLGLALWKRKAWILWPTVVVAIVSAIGVNMITPRYKSEARILYDGRENVFLRPEAEKSINGERPAADPETLTSQVQLVLSRQLALEVIGQLKLNDLPEFDPLLRPPSILRHILSLIGISRDLMAMTPEERVLESWYDRLTAYPVDKSRVIVIEFQSWDPALAARVTNAIADTYLRMEQSVRQEQTRGAGQWLAGEIDKLRGKVADAEAKVEEFRSYTNLLVGTNNTTLSNQQLGELNSQVVSARGQKADAETRAKIIRDMLRNGESIEASDIVNSELVRRLSEQRGILRAQLAEQSSQLLSGHPRIKELKAQIGDFDKQIRAEAEKLVRTLENEARIAGARVEASSANLDMVKRQAASTNEQDVQLRALERESKAQRDLLESYLAKYRETTARETIGSAPPDAKIISAAIASNTPYFPKKLPIVAVATLITLILSAGLVTTGELLHASAGAPALPAGDTFRAQGRSRCADQGGVGRPQRRCVLSRSRTGEDRPSAAGGASQERRRRRATSTDQCRARPRRCRVCGDGWHTNDGAGIGASARAGGRRQGGAGQPGARCGRRRSLGSGVWCDWPRRRRSRHRVVRSGHPQGQRFAGPSRSVRPARCRDRCDPRFPAFPDHDRGARQGL